LNDLVATILEADVALAGLLLVFVGLVYSRGKELDSRTGNRFKIVARMGILPMGLSLWCAWICVNYLTGDVTLFRTVVIMFRSDLILTGFYALIVLFVYL
jgi:hypothetical protein